MPEQKGVHATLLDRAHAAAEVAIETILDKRLRSASGMLGGYHVKLIYQASKFKMFCARRRASQIRVCIAGLVPKEAREKLPSIESEAEERYGYYDQNGYWTFKCIGGYFLDRTSREAAKAGALAFSKVLEEDGILVEIVEHELIRH